MASEFERDRIKSDFLMLGHKVDFFAPRMGAIFAGQIDYGS